MKIKTFLNVCKTKKIKIEIKSYYSNDVIFSHECENNTIAITVQVAKVCGINLGFADFSQMNLQKTDFSDLNLRCAKFCGADLCEANFERADLNCVDFRNANLQNANFSYTEIRCANLNLADFKNANFQGANLQDSILQASNFCEADFSYANLSWSTFQRSDLSNAIFFATKIYFTDFINSNFNLANFDGADVGEFGTVKGVRPFFQIGPIGVRKNNLLAFKTDKGVFIYNQGFYKSFEEFKNKIESNLVKTVYGKEYEAALVMIDAHYTLWSTTNT